MCHGCGGRTRSGLSTSRYVDERGRGGERVSAVQAACCMSQVACLMMHWKYRNAGKWALPVVPVEWELESASANATAFSFRRTHRCMPW